MKEGWKYSKLSEVCDFSSGFAFKSNLFKESGKPIIRISDIQNDIVDDSNVAYFDLNDYTQNLSRYIVYPNDILIAMSGGTTGKIGINTTGKQFYLNQRVGVFRENSSFLNHYYLYYFLKTKSEESLKIAAGAAQPNLSTQQINNFIIPLPPLSDQQRIVEYLDSAFAKIDALKAKAKENLDNAQALFQAALTEAMTPKEGWEEKTLGEVTTKIGSGATPKGGKKVYISEGCSLIRSMNVQYHAFKYKELAFINEDAANQLKGVTIQKNDVLFNITGASIARCCVVPNDVIPARVNQHVAIIRLNKDIVIPNYLSYLLNSPYHQKSLLEIGETGSTRQALTKSDLENHPISFPSKREQENLISMLDKMQDRITVLIDNYTTLSASCDTLKQSLLRQVFE